MTNRKVWPINTATSCQFKWTWSTLFLNAGTTSSCHRCQQWEVDKDTVMNFNNVPGKIKDRELMLDGKWCGNGCEYCSHIEQAGGLSERQSYINDLPMSPPEFDTNPQATHVTPRLLEVYFTNLCNQSCTYCTPRFSSVIQAELEKYGPISFDSNYYDYHIHPQYNEMLLKFWEWMELNAHHLYMFQILGGEPMYQPEFDQCLDFFDTHPCPDLAWGIFSNLKHDPKKFRERIYRIKRLIDEGKLQRFEIVCSIDCWGPESEFVRRGMDLAQWEENFNTLLEIDESSLFIKIHSTMSAITFPTMADLYSKIIEWQKIRSVRYSWNTIQNPTCFNPYVFGHHLAPYIDKLKAVLPDNYSDMGVQDLDGIKSALLNTPVDKAGIANFKGYLDELDRRRNTNWRQLFPQIADIVSKELDE